MRPELEDLRDDPETAPELGQRDVAVLEARVRLGVEALELRAICERRGLRRRPGRDLTGAGSGRPVRLRLLVRDLLDRALDADLPPELPPVHDRRRVRV